MPEQSKHQNIGLSIDQSQLAQINLLMSDLSKTESPTTAAAAADNISQTQNLLDFLGTSPLLNHQQQISPNDESSGGIVPNSNQTQSSSQQQIILFEQNGRQLQQQQQQQVHTIMVNGQPALFIPSSAISSNLMCQIIGQQQQQQQSPLSGGNESASNPGDLVFELASSGTPATTTTTNSDFTAILSNDNTNQQILVQTTECQTDKQAKINSNLGQQRNPGTNNTVLQPHQLINIGQFMLNNNESTPTNNNIQQYFIQMPASTTSTTNNTNGIVVKTENTEPSEIQQQHQQIFIQQQQQHQQQAQIICVQPDGTITFQAIQQNPVLFQPSVASVTTSNNPKKIPITPYGEGRKKIVSKRHASKTIASALQQQQLSSSASTKKKITPQNQPVYTLDAQVQIPTIVNAVQQPQMLQMLQFPSIIEQQQQQQQQWIIINNPNELTMMNNNNNILSAMVLPAASNNNNNEKSGNNKIGKEPEPKKPRITIRKSLKISDDASSIFKEIISNGVGGVEEENKREPFLKKKRTPCACPNCVKRLKENENGQTGAGKEVPSGELILKRTHQCHLCAKEYNKTSHLRAHLRGHDNNRPYVCDFKACGKTFTRSDELKRHKRIHVDERNFVCLICKKRFLRSDHLNKHLLIHAKSPTAMAQLQLESKTETTST